MINTMGVSMSGPVVQWTACIDPVYRHRRAASGDHGRPAGSCTRKLMSTDLRVDGWAGVQDGCDSCIHSYPDG